MDRLSLPLLDPSRTELGFERTQCSCHAYTISCRHIPGYLLPSDLLRLSEVHQPKLDILTWASQYLLASPGAIVARKGHLLRIPTLVPARRDDGACIFLTTQNACAVHAVAPFGCAFFDAHMSGVQADHRSLAGLHTIARAWQANELYATLWWALYQAGHVAPAPEEARRRMQQETQGSGP
jgi:hypothetical protein